MKKSSFLKVLLSVLFSFALAVSCDSGGGGGGGSGGNSASSDSTKVSINIPATTSSDVDIFMDLQSPQLSDFQYEVYFSKPNGSGESEHKYVSEGETVTFENVKYDTYDFFLKIWVDDRRKTSIYENKITKSISGSDNAVNFPSRSLSDYSNWFFVSDESELSQAVSTISERDYSASKKAVICLKQTIRANAESFFANIREKVTIEKNGYEIAENVYNIEYILDDGTNGSGNPLSFTRTSSQVELSDAHKDDYLFYGWYESDDFSTEPVTTLDFSNRTDGITLYARWVDSIYVSDSGDDTTGDGLSAGNAVSSLEAAITKINEYATLLGKADFDWKIKVVGTLTGMQKIAKDTETTTNPSAASITLEGEDSGKIDGNGSNDSALTIEVTIPVTIKNLTITNAASACNFGCGMTVQHGADVTLSDGAKVTGCTYTGSGSPQGIGIFVDGSSTPSNLTVTGTAEITGNKNMGSGPASRGGGISAYANATVVVSGSAKITGNEARDGNGVSIAASSSGIASIEIKESAQVQDVYLNSNTTDYIPKIKVTAAVTNDVVVEMNSGLMQTGTQILYGEAIEENYGKFKAVGTHKVTSDGTLAEKDSVADIVLEDFDYFTFTNNNTTPGSKSWVSDNLILFKTSAWKKAVYATFCAGSFGFSAKIRTITDTADNTTEISSGNYAGINLDTNAGIDDYDFFGINCYIERDNGPTTTNMKFNGALEYYILQ